MGGFFILTSAGKPPAFGIPVLLPGFFIDLNHLASFTQQYSALEMAAIAATMDNQVAAELAAT